MRKIFTPLKLNWRVQFLFLFISTISFPAFSQTVIISPNGAGGFVNGGSFADNGWTVVNGSATNKWFVGNPGIFSDERAYISDEPSGFSYSYDPSGNSMVHFYMDVTFPAGETKISLNFTWSGIGEVTAYDGLQVSLAPTSITPSASTTTGTALVTGPLVTGATVVGETFYYNSSIDKTETITIPSSLTGNCSAASTMRLIFTWRNDNSAGISPPISIDNISLTSETFSLLSGGGTFTINNTQGTGGTNYKSFNDAITELNIVSGCGGFSGPIVFNVTAGQNFSEDLPNITASGTAAKPITFQRSGAGVNPVIKPTGGSGTQAGITVEGGDYITFDGIDIKIASGNAVEYGYQIRSFGTSGVNGAQNNTIKNCKIELNRSNTQSYGIYQNTLTASSTDGTCSYNSYLNVVIENVYTGIYLNASFNFPDIGCTIGTTGTGQTIIGSSISQDIGGGTQFAYGIRAEDQQNLTIHNTEIRNVGIATTFTTTVGGISIQGATGTTNVYKNTIHDISSSSTGNANLFGIRAEADAGATINIYNNIIYGLSSGTSAVGGTPSIRAIQANTSTASTGTVNVYYNNIRLEITNSGASNTVFYKQAGTVNLMNNVLANFSAAGTGGLRYVIFSESATLVSNYNDLYIVTGTNNNIGYSNGSTRATIETWRTGTSQDINSVNVDPYFSSSTNLHVGNGVLNGKAIPITSPAITDDIDGDVRDATTPDIGADEIVLVVKMLQDISYEQASNAWVKVNSSNAAILKLGFIVTGNDGVLPLTTIKVTSMNTSDADVTAVKLYKTTSSTFSTSNLIGTTTFDGTGKAEFSIVNEELPGNTTTYYWIAFDVAGVVGNMLDAKIEANGITVSGATYPSVDVSPIGERFFLDNISGGFYVGANQPAPHFTTLTAAIADLSNFGIDGPVELHLAADYNSALETFPITIPVISGSSAVNTIKIRPAAGVTASISGSSTAIIKLNGADNIIIDGSNNSTTTRNLSIINNSSTQNTAAIWISSLGAGAGATNCTIKNCVINAGGTSTNLFGIIASGTTLSNVTTNAGSDNDNLTISNNQVYNAAWGIYINSNSGVVASGNATISQNIVGHNDNSSSIASSGITLVGCADALVEKNTIFNVRGSQFATNGPRGININTGTTTSTINANTIYDIIYTGAAGGGGKGIDVQAGTSLVISNNSISNIQGDGWNNMTNLVDAIVGIRLLGSSINVYNNSVNLGSGIFSGNNSSTAVSAAIGIGNSASSINIVNNILASNLQNSVQPAAKTYAVYTLSSAAAIPTMDYNKYYVSGTQGILGFISSDRTTLAAFKSGFGKNTNSVTSDPGFTGSTDLQPKQGYFTSGTNIPTITTDIVGTTRYIVPDIGAYEGSASGRWTGGVSTDWQNTSNWKDGLVPGTTVDVALNVDAPNLPSLTAASNAKNIALPTTSSILNLNGQRLVVSGALSGNGFLAGTSNSALELSGAAGSVKFSTTANTLKELKLNTGATATLGNTLNITPLLGQVSVASGATLNTGGNLVLKSDATGTANVAASAGTISGNVTIERYIPASGNRAWRLLAAPVTSASAPTIYSSWQESGANASGYGTHITSVTGSGTNGFDASTIAQATSARYYDGTTTQAILNTNTTKVTDNGGAYFVFIRGDRTVDLSTSSSSSNTVLRMKGAIKQGNISTGVTGSSFSLIPNPYPSAVDFDAVRTANGNINNFTIWDATLGSVGGYRAVQRTSGGVYEQTPSAGATGNARYIHSGQAFYVPGNTTLSFTESMKTLEVPGTAVMRTASPGEQILIHLYVNNAGTYSLLDGIRAKFGDDYTSSVDTDDVPKLNNMGENLSIVKSGQLLTVESRPFVMADDTLFLNLSGVRVKQYKLVIDPAEMDASGLVMYLKDNHLNTLTPIANTGSTEVSFDVNNAAGSWAVNRFQIVMKVAGTLPISQLNLQAAQQGKEINLRWTMYQEQNLQQFDVEHSSNGREFEKIGEVAPINEKGIQEYNSWDKQPVEGINYYRVRTLTKTGGTFYSNVVKVNTGKNKPGISVYPNPLKGNIVNLEFLSMESGTYSVQLFNQLGQEVYKETLSHRGGSYSGTLSMPTLQPGQYVLIVSNGNEVHTLSISKL